MNKLLSILALGLASGVAFAQTSAPAAAPKPAAAAPAPKPAAAAPAAGGGMPPKK